MPDTKESVEERFAIPIGGCLNDGRRFHVVPAHVGPLLRWEVYAERGILYGKFEHWINQSVNGLALYAFDGTPLRGFCTSFSDVIYYLDMYYDSATVPKPGEGVSA